MPNNPKIPVPVRFWPKVERSVVADECWPWLGALDPKGYGRFRDARGRSRPAHQAAYELCIGAIPVGLTVDHLCHNADETCVGGPTCLHRRCVNPMHLEAVSMGVNVLRGRSPAAQHARATGCPQGHPWSEANIY